MLGAASKPTPPPGVGGAVSAHTQAHVCPSLLQAWSMAAPWPAQSTLTLGNAPAPPRLLTAPFRQGIPLHMRPLAKTPCLKFSHPWSVRHCGPTHPKGHQLPVSEQP